MTAKGLVIAACLGIAYAQSPGTGVVSGTVVDGGTGDAIRKAIVTLSLEGTPRRWATARSDGSGHFQFDSLPAGRYDLSAAKQGEGQAVYGVNRVHELPGVIELADGQTLTGVKLRFLRTGTISGRVLDSDGDPVADAIVTLLHSGRDFGASRGLSHQISQTGDRGDYRISGLDAGRYNLYVRAQTGGMLRVYGASSKVPMGQYYAGARELKDATPVSVHQGETVSGIDFRIASETPVEVHGKINVSEDVARAFQSTEGRQGIQVLAHPAAAEAALWATGAGAQGPDYRFQIANLTPGSYRVEAMSYVKSKGYGATALVDLNDGSKEISLTLAPYADIHGTLRVEEPAKPGGKPSNYRVQLNQSGAVREPIRANVGADGKFMLAQVPPGEWDLDVTPADPGFLKSVHLGDKDVRFKPLTVGAEGIGPLNIVVGTHTASIAGEVDPGTSGSKRAGIVVAPVAGLYHSLLRFYHQAASGPDGKFEVKGIAPGKYKVFAFENLDAKEFCSPEAVDQLEAFGEAVDLAGDAQVEVHPKMIPAERTEKILP